MIAFSAFSQFSSDLLELLLQLVRTAEKVCVILGEATHPRKAVQLAALLIAVHGAELGEAQREIPVRAGRTAENLTMVRAVHGLQHVFLPFLGRMYGLEGILSVLGIMAGSHI